MGDFPKFGHILEIADKCILIFAAYSAVLLINIELGIIHRTLIRVATPLAENAPK